MGATKKASEDDGEVIPVRDPRRGRDGRGRPMLTIPKRRLVNEAPRRGPQAPPV